MINLMDPLYKVWVFDGEKSSPSSQSVDVEVSETYRLFRDMYPQDDVVTEPMHEEREVEFAPELEIAETPLYAGCTKYTKFSAVAVLYKYKVTHNLTDKSSLLDILRDMLQDNTLPRSMYETKKLFKEFDLVYDKIDACVNDCCFFWKENDGEEVCPKCGSSW